MILQKFLKVEIALKIQTGLRSIILMIMILAGWSICTGQTMLRYYGVDDIEPGEFSFLKDSLGGNFAMIELSTDSIAWKNALAEAEKNELKIIIWPLGSGHQWTPWAWNGTSWDISQGLDVMKYAEAYTNSGGEALVAVVMSHEPFYNNGDPFTTSEMKMLYADLKDVAPHVKLFVYMNDMAYYDKRPDTKIEDGIMDIAGIWLHCFGGEEGTWDQIASYYTSYLSKDRYDSSNADRWAVVRQLSEYLPITGIHGSGINSCPFSLSQNYPNPFYLNTTIEFEVLESGLYTIKVFDLLGKQVATLFDRSVSPGTYTVDFNANRLSSGMYIYTLQNKNSVITNKMIFK